MTLADRIEAVLVEHGPMPSCHLATWLYKRRDEVDRVLAAHPGRFVHNGRKARASRWGLFDADALANRWEALLELDAFTARSFVSHWIETGLLEPVDRNGRVAVTEHGRDLISGLLTGSGK
jgi:hypothetical protein